jgi:hypothetical protein
VSSEQLTAFCELLDYPRCKLVLELIKRFHINSMIRISHSSLDLSSFRFGLNQVSHPAVVPMGRCGRRLRFYQGLSISGTRRSLLSWSRRVRSRTGSRSSHGALGKFDTIPSSYI